MSDRRRKVDPPIKREIPTNKGIPEETSEVLLEAVQLSKTFTTGNEELVILNGINLTVQKGCSIAILGASGSGKSTLLYLLGGLDQPTAGQVLSKGRSVFSLSESYLAHWRGKEIGFIFQFHHLLSDFTALENVAMPLLLTGQTRKVAFDEAGPMLERVGLKDRKNHRPGALSGGEQQRVAIARALIMSPEVLLADEPTGNLDARNASMVNELICQLVKERNLSAIVVTHNAKLAGMMDTCLELYEGKLRPWKG
ncbi:MAG: ABC transporter ATP-binding protein [Deltaproteobacteria bacterium]|jgi:lipoprotein-releasing system ATP-binding protein|nr:ABC transporter ATP-binding protein [Deltaproteobacteria bacterium]